MLPGSHTHRERDHGGCSPFTRRPTRVRPMSPAWMVRRIGDGNICPRRISIEHKSERGRNSCSVLAPHRAYRSPSLSIRCHDHGHARVFVSPGGRRFDCAWRISRNATASDRLHACVSVVPPATSSDVGRFEFTLVCVVVCVCQQWAFKDHTMISEACRTVTDPTLSARRTFLHTAQVTLHLRVWRSLDLSFASCAHWRMAALVGDPPSCVRKMT